MRIPRIPRSHTSTKHCLCSTPLELPLQRPCTAQTSAGSWFTRRGVLASQTSLPVHNTFPAIHNLIYVTIAPINNSVGQLRNYSLKGPELLFLPLPRPICLVSRLRGASCPQVSPARQGWWLHPSPIGSPLCHVPVPQCEGHVDAIPRPRLCHHQQLPPCSAAPYGHSFPLLSIPTLNSHLLNRIPQVLGSRGCPALSSVTELGDRDLSSGPAPTLGQTPRVLPLCCQSSWGHLGCVSSLAPKALLAMASPPA